LVDTISLDFPPETNPIAYALGVDLCVLEVEKREESQLLDDESGCKKRLSLIMNMNRDGVVL